MNMRGTAAAAASATVACAAFGPVVSSFASLVRGGSASWLRGSSSSAAARQELQAQRIASSEGVGASQAGVAFAGLAAAGLVAAARRSAAARRASLFGEDAVEKPEVFAGGLVGSEYAGWGTYQFDPLNLSNNYPELLPWFREAELKHGRIAMLACVGAVVPEAVRLPMDVFSDPGLDFVTAHSKLIGPGLGEGPMWYLLIFCSVIESFRFKTMGLGFEKLTLENAGDLDFGKGFMPKTEEGMKQMQIKELKNGRLAMLAFSGAVTQAVLWNQHNFPYA